MKRLFVCIPYLPGSQFNSMMRELKNSCQGDRINWVKPGHMHCTIQFLGDCNEELIPVINEAVAMAARGIAPFSVVSGGLGYFGSPGQPKVLWAGWEDNGMAESLFRRLSPILQKAGISEPENHYHPHITIGRVKFSQNPSLLVNTLKRYRDDIHDRFTATQVCLMESRLTPEGPVYEIITQIPLV